jgi:O-antigen/teichoic acid export membrane protein
MNTIQKHVKNILVPFVSQVISYLLGFYFTIYTARYLGAEGFGILSFALAFSGVWGVFADLGLCTLMVREVARNKSMMSKYVGNILVMKIILAISIFGMIAFTITFLDYPDQIVKVVFFIALSILINGFSQIFYSVFQAHEKMEYQSLCSVLYSALLLTGALFAISKQFDVVGFAFLYFIVSTLVFGVAFIIFMWKFILPKMEINFSFWKPVLKETLPFAITGISFSIYVWIDTIMLSLLKGEEVVGWYNAAYRIILVLVFIPVIFRNTMFPLMSRFYVSSQEKLRLYFEKILKIMIFISLPLGVGTVFISDKVILLVYGRQFFQSIIALQILVWSLVLIFARCTFECLLESVNRQIIVTKIFIIGAFFNVFANLLLIPKYSYIGAGIVTVFTDIIVLVILIMATKKIGHSLPKTFSVDVIKIIFASVVMGIFLKCLINLSLLLLITACIIIYVLISSVVKVFNREDILLVKSIFK